jgi:hypothetical protein
LGAIERWQRAVRANLSSQKSTRKPALGHCLSLAFASACGCHRSLLLARRTRRVPRVLMTFAGAGLRHPLNGSQRGGARDGGLSLGSGSGSADIATDDRVDLPFPLFIGASLARLRRGPISVLQRSHTQGIGVPAIGCRRPDPPRSRLFQRTRTLPALVTAGAGAVIGRNRRHAPAPVSNHVATAALVASMRPLNRSVLKVATRWSRLRG